MSPCLIAWPAGVSTTPSPQTAEVSTPELWFGNRSSPPAAVRRTRRNSRRLSGFGQSKSAQQAEIDAACELIDFLRFNVHYARRVIAEQPRSVPGEWNRMDWRPLDGFVGPAVVVSHRHQPSAKPS